MGSYWDASGKLVDGRYELAVSNVKQVELITSAINQAIPAGGRYTSGTLDTSKYVALSARVRWSVAPTTTAIEFWDGSLDTPAGQNLTPVVSVVSSDQFAAKIAKKNGDGTSIDVVNNHTAAQTATLIQFYGWRA